MTDSKYSWAGRLGAAWGLGGVILVIAMAVKRLTPYALALVGYHLTTTQSAVLVTFVGFMLFTEAYLGFQKRFAPRVAARALHLLRNPEPINVMLAPLFCFSFFHTSRRRQLTSIGLVMMMITLVVLMRGLAQPWRGIVDTGVVIGLVWGIFTLVYFGYRAFTDPKFNHSAETPQNRLHHQIRQP